MGTKYKGTKAEVSGLNTFIKLVRAAESVSSRVESHFASLGLTVSQFGILDALCHLGPLFQKDLARKILKSGGNVTMVIDNLEKRGLVERVRDESDRRHYLVRPTQAGERLIKDFFPGHVSRIVKEMSILTRTEQKTLGDLCKKIGLQQRSAE